MKAKVIGAGSAGIHITQSCRRLGMDVCVVDNDPEALRRMREDIYPARYGGWDKRILQIHGKTLPQTEAVADVVFVATPPDVRMDVAREVLLKENPALLHMEKPFCAPKDILNNKLELFLCLANKSNTTVLSGYNHTVSLSSKEVVRLYEANREGFGKVLTIDVDWREHWQGILDAHPWRSGIADSYIGYWKKGGGAAFEHSHGLCQWIYFARALAKSGPIVFVDAMMDKISDSGDGGVEYDSMCFLNLETESGFKGRVVQDVVTKPTKKCAKITTEKGFIEWQYGAVPEGDLVVWHNSFGDGRMVFRRTRPDDFWYQAREILSIYETGRRESSALDSRFALEVLFVLFAAHKSADESKKAILNHKKAWSQGMIEMI